MTKAFGIGRRVQSLLLAQEVKGVFRPSTRRAWRSSLALWHFLRLEIRHRVEVEALHLGPGPRGLAQELQARFHAGIGKEAVDPDPLAQLFPAVVRLQLRHHHFESDAMKWISGAVAVHAEDGELEWVVVDSTTSPSPGRACDCWPG